MKKTFRRTIALMVALSVFLASCGEAEPTLDVDAVMTEGVGTMVAAFFETQTAMYTPPSPTSTATYTPFPSPTAPPTSTFIPSTPTLFFLLTATLGTISPLTAVASGTYVTATVNPSVLGAGCNNLAFIRDVTIPDGTVLQPAQDFVKTWKVQNTGTCNWLPQYSLVLISGTDMDAGVTKIQKTVEVGSWSELSVNITSPNKEGTYTSYWRLADTSGTLFGSTLAVVIEVKK